VDLAIAHPLPHRLPLFLPLRPELFPRLEGFDALPLSDELEIVAVDVKTALFEHEPVVEAGMVALGADALAAQIRDALDAGIRPHSELRVHRIQRLAEIDPFVAAGARAIGRNMIASDKFHRT